MMDRQTIVGWILVAWAGGYLAFMLKTRYLAAGLPLERREWAYLIMSLIGLMIGTINVRMAAARRKRQAR